MTLKSLDPVIKQPLLYAHYIEIFVVFKDLGNSLCKLLPPIYYLLVTPPINCL